MAIIKPQSSQLNTFLSQAPDGGRVAAVTPQDSEDAADMTQISLRISKQDLAEIDAAAKQLRMPRATLLRAAAFKYIRSEN
jgi:hypothetical protein